MPRPLPSLEDTRNNLDWAIAFIEDRASTTIDLNIVPVLQALADNLPALYASHALEAFMAARLKEHMSARTHPTPTTKTTT